MSIRDRLYQRLYPGPGTQNPFDVRYLALSASAGRVLDLGAGRGTSPGRRTAPPHTLVIGADPTRAVAANPWVDHAVVTFGEELPFATGTFDICVMRWVAEHLPEPETTFREIGRVLGPAGRLLILTSNLLFFAYGIAAMVPNRLHPWLVRLTTGRAEQDVFPTYYRANTPRRVRRLLRTAGYSRCTLTGFQHGPGYLGFSWPTLLLGAAYDSLVNLTPMLQGLRQGLIVEAQKS